MTSLKEELSKLNLAFHTIYNPIGKHKCPFCPECFRIKKNLNDHIKINHKIELEIEDENITRKRK